MKRWLAHARQMWAEWVYNGLVWFGAASAIACIISLCVLAFRVAKLQGSP